MECTAASGGVMVVSAAYKSIGIVEVTKCVTGGIGKSGGCFGPNNTIVQFLQNAYNDVFHGWGENNEIHRGLVGFDRARIDFLNRINPFH